MFWGPLTLPAQIAMPADMIVITYDATGHVLREVPSSSSARPGARRLQRLKGQGLVVTAVRVRG